jgi:uncharacterized membrane protein YcaP (DUF421 family)
MLRARRDRARGDTTMWQPSLPWWEFVIRGAMIYLFLTIVLRITGKRQMGHLAPFDLILLLVLSNTVQNAMNGGDNSVPGGLISASTVIALNFAVSWLTFHNRTLARLIEGRAVILVRNGKIDERARRHAMMTREELLAALRAQDCHCLEDIEYAMLENTGEVSVVRRMAAAGRSPA